MHTKYNQQEFMSNTYKEQSKKVADYYDKWNDRYDAVYGKIIQAHRPPNDEDLLNYTLTSAGLQDGQTILDAGCGNCGPAIYFAKALKVYVEGLSISPYQVEESKRRIAENGLQERISVTCGDYHELSGLYTANKFDRILFLESLGHAGNPSSAIASAYEILKPGGEIYIKDFYAKKSLDNLFQEKINQVVSNLNRHYSYNVMDLESTIGALRKSNFEIDFIKRIDFKNDASIKNDFEAQFGIDLFEGMEEFYFAEWLEIKCFKPL